MHHEPHHIEAHTRRRVLASVRAHLQRETDDNYDDNDDDDDAVVQHASAALLT